MVEEEQTCYKSCAATKTHLFSVPDSFVCIIRCQKETPYHLDNLCYRVCPPESFERRKDFGCELAGTAYAPLRSVTFSGSTHWYLLLQAPSYSALDWNVGGTRGAAFLQTGSVLVALRLRATTKTAAYVPFVFNLAEKIIASELQLIAEDPKASAMLATSVQKSPEMIRCVIVEAFQRSGIYRLALDGRGARAVDCTLELGKNAPDGEGDL